MDDNFQGERDERSSQQWKVYIGCKKMKIFSECEYLLGKREAQDSSFKGRYIFEAQVSRGVRKKREERRKEEGETKEKKIEKGVMLLPKQDKDFYKEGGGMEVEVECNSSSWMMISPKLVVFSLSQKANKHNHIFFKLGDMEHKFSNFHTKFSQEIVRLESTLKFLETLIKNTSSACTTKESNMNLRMEFMEKTYKAMQDYQNMLENDVKNIANDVEILRAKLTSSFTTPPINTTMTTSPNLYPSIPSGKLSLPNIVGLNTAKKPDEIIYKNNTSINTPKEFELKSSIDPGYIPKYILPSQNPSFQDQHQQQQHNPSLTSNNFMESKPSLSLAEDNNRIPSGISRAMDIVNLYINPKNQAGVTSETKGSSDNPPSMLSGVLGGKNEEIPTRQSDFRRNPDIASLSLSAEGGGVGGSGMIDNIFGFDNDRYPYEKAVFMPTTTESKGLIMVPNNRIPSESLKDKPYMDIQQQQQHQQHQLPQQQQQEIDFNTLLNSSNYSNNTGSSISGKDKLKIAKDPTKFKPDELPSPGLSSESESRNLHTPPMIDSNPKINHLYNKNSHNQENKEHESDHEKKDPDTEEVELSLEYQVDSNGYLMDEEGNYILDDAGNKVKLAEDQLEEIKIHHHPHHNMHIEHN